MTNVELLKAIRDALIAAVKVMENRLDDSKAKKVASELIEPGAYLWWERYAGGWTFKLDEWRYYLYRAHAYPYHWLLRCGYDEELVMIQGVESYREFVAQCEEYVNERHGQCSLWEV